MSFILPTPDSVENIKYKSSIQIEFDHNEAHYTMYFGQDKKLMIDNISISKVNSVASNINSSIVEIIDTDDEWFHYIKDLKYYKVLKNPSVNFTFKVEQKTNMSKRSFIMSFYKGDDNYELKFCPAQNVEFSLADCDIPQLKNSDLKVGFILKKNGYHIDLREKHIDINCIKNYYKLGHMQCFGLYGYPM